MHTPEAASADDSWLTAGRFALLLSLLVFITFPGVALGTQTFVFRDYGLFSYPVAFFQRQCFWRGELPLWNPYSQCGLPFLAQWNTMCLYPPALWYLVLPLTWALSFFCLAHLVWGGVGMYHLARHWTGNRLGGALAGVIFTFNGLNLNFLMWPSHVATFSWLPWVIWLVPRGWQQGGRALLWAALAGAMQMLAGGPETILLTWLVLFTLACGDWITAPRPKPGDPSDEELSGTKDEPSQEGECPREPHVNPLHCSRGHSPCHASPKQMALRFVGTALLVALICSAQLLPFLQLLAHSQRDTGYGSTGWPMPASGWANFLVPLFNTSRTPQGVYMQNGQYWTSSYYAGIGTVFLAVLALWRVRDWRLRLCWVLTVLAVVLSLGNAGVLYAAFRRGVPGLGISRYPIKFVILVSALAPLLAAFGVRELAKLDRRRRRSWWFCALGIILLTGFILAPQWTAPPSGRRIIFQNGLARIGLLIVILGLTSLLARKEASLVKSRRVIMAISLLVVFWFDFLTHVPNQNPTAPPSVYVPDALNSERHWESAPKLGRSRAMLSPAAQADLKYHSLTNIEASYLLSRLGLLADCNLLDEIPQAHGFFSLAPSEINDASSVWYVQTNRDFSALLDFMGVSQVSATNQAFEWSARPSAMPLVTAGQAPEFTDDRAAFAAFSQPDTDFRRTVFLPLTSRKEVSATNQPNVHIGSTLFANQKVTAEVNTPAPCIVVLAQTWYPPWKAYVDGRPTQLWRANYAFQALQIPTGNHQIELKYQDCSFRAGVALSAVGMAVWALLWRRRPLPEEKLGATPRPS